MFFTLQNVEFVILPPQPWEPACPDLVWTRIIIFFFLWWAYYFLVCRVFRKEPEYCCRFVTLTHGIMTTYFTLRDILANRQEFDFCCTTPLLALQIYFLSVTISYFVFDLLWINLFGSESITIHLHHVCSILLLFKLLTSDTGGPGLSYGLLGLEFTNPYLQTRWFLRTHGYQNRPIHRAVEIWFIVSFLVIRVIGGTTLLYYVEIHPNIDMTLKIAFIGIYVVSWLLVVQILQFFRRKYYRVAHPILTTSVLSIFPYRRRDRPTLEAEEES